MADPTLPDAWKYRLKAAFRDLVELSGGYELAAQRLSYGKSSLQRWGSPIHGELPPIVACILLEIDTGMPLVTTALAALQGLALKREEGDGARAPAPSLLGLHADLSAAAAAVQSEMATAMADGVVTVTEQQRVDEKASALAANTEHLRQAMAAGAALKVVA